MEALKDCLGKLLPLTSRGRGTVLESPPAAPEMPEKPDRRTQTLKIMSYNVLCRMGGEYGLARRYNGVLRTILGEMPDSIGLQEAHELWKGPLKRDLKAHYAMACGHGRLFGVHEAMPVFYLKEKYQAVRQGWFWLSQRPGISSIGWDASCPRICGWVVLRDKKTGFTYAHFNTHLDHKGPIAMANGARLVAGRINAMGLPAVLTGDLNEVPGSRPMQYLEAGGLVDLRFAAKKSDEGPTFHGYDDKDLKAIDYVYANGYLREAAEFKVMQDRYDGIYPSDHWAVCGKLVLAN